MLKNSIDSSVLFNTNLTAKEKEINVDVNAVVYQGCEGY